MNKLKNIAFIERHGDGLQLEFGAEFGFFAKQLDRNKINEFCAQFNAEPWINEHGYFLTSKYNSNDYILTLSNPNLSLRVSVKLLDHSIYIDAIEQDWMKIEKILFILLQKAWRNFMAENISEYDEHIRKTFVLANLETVYAI